ncbi:MAG: peptidoglycan-binding protein [Epsilonproteobacteria bacterium]|nr:peptidoglycan-binding protein [Campylobacterota bacterium]NPA56904.1 peptidoglycan-binding protein [Campylobacterota bacterium]
MLKVGYRMWIGAVAIAFVATGCAQKSASNLPVNCSTIEECAQLAKQKEEELAKTQALLAEKESEVSKLKEDVDNCKRMAMSASAEREEGVAQPNAVKVPESGLLLLPPDAKPGECYGKVVIPPKYKYVKEKVVIDEGGERVVTIPPKYRWVTKKILVREPGEKIIPTPPVYKTVTERIVVKPETEKVVVVRPAKYKWVTQKVEVEPAHTKWVRGSLLHQTKANLEVLDKQFNPSVGEVMCLVKVPPKYKTIRKKVMVEPPVTKVVKVPPVYKTITKKVLVKPAGTKVIKIPPVYKTIRVKELVEPARTVTKQVPPRYKYITKKVKVRDIQYKFEPVVCKTNLTPNLVVNLQRKLKELGYYKGPIDGIYGPMTAKAVDRYQKDHGFARGALTIETIEALGLSY